MKINLYLDRFGGVTAIKEFLLSLVKTMVAAGIAYIIQRLGDLSVSTPELVGLIAVIRGLLTGAGKWSTTTRTVQG